MAVAETRSNQALYADVCSNVQSKYTEQLRNLPDLESLLPHFEERNIITFHQHVEIKNSNSPTEDRMKMLLDNISLPLQNGSTERFDSMLEIFTDHGADETKMIASSMQSEVQGFVQFRSHLQTIEDLMPVDFMRTTDKLYDCFTDSQVGNVFNCESSIVANQLIIKYLTVNLSDVKDLLTLCTQLKKISTSHKLDMVISDIRKSCAVKHPRHEHPRDEHCRHRPEENRSSVSTVFRSQEVDNEQQCTDVEVFQPVSDIVSINGTEADPEIDHNVHGHERKDTDSVSTVPFETQSLPTGILNEQNKDKPPYRPQRSDPHPLPSHPLPMKQRISFKYLPPPSMPEYHIRRHYLFNKIAQAICSSSGTFVPGEECVMVTIAGAGGFGKTTIALDLCHHHDVKYVFTNGIIFIELGPQTCDPGKILNDHYCQMAGKDYEYINNVEEKIQELTKIYKNILVIIDDVWRVEDARPIVKAFSYCKIILTTRNPDIGIPSKQTIDIGPMSLTESVSLMTNGVLEYSELSKEDVKVINELAQSTHQWPLLLTLIRGQLYNSVNKSHTTLKNAILDVQGNLTVKGLSAFDNKTSHNIRQLSVRACIEVSLGLLDEADESDESLKLKDKLLSLILYTGIGGSLPSQAVECLWNVSGETAKKATSLLQQYGLVNSKCSKQMPPCYSTAYMFVTVHSVISEYIMSTIKSETVARLSPFIFLNTDKLIARVEQLLFQQSHEVNPFNKPEYLEHNKLKMEHIVLPYYMKEINMHVLHDPHLALLILHNIQSLLNDARYYHLLASFNEEIVTLITECHNALSNAQGLSRKVNEHFQLCFRIMSFDNLIPLLKEYLETHFITSTITRCVELTETVSTQCDAELKAAMTTKREELQILTKEYHAISAEKLPRFKLYIELHNNTTRALLQNNDDEIEKLYVYITTEKFEDEVQLVHDNYSIKIQDGNSGEKALVTNQQNKYMESLHNEVQQQRQSMTDLAITDRPHLPPDIVNWIGGIETQSFDDGGGLFCSFNHDTTVTIPPGAIPKGKQGMLKFAATLCAPVRFAPNVVPVSAIVWLCMDVELQKPITLCLPHCVRVENISHVNSLCFAKMTHASSSEGYMSVIDSGEFKVGEAFGLVEIEKSCYYCIVNSATVAKDIPENKYRIIAMKHKIPKIDRWNCDVCLTPSLTTCKTHLEEQYRHKTEEFMCDREESEFTFGSCSTKLKLDINKDQFNNDAEVEITSEYEISKENVDFQQCYRNHLLLKELKEKVEFGSYPPRLKLGIKVKNRSFFGTQQRLEFVLMGGKESLQKNITIAAAFNDIP
ncbi:uncharacterized protein [Dysidea avara]|uniref:uncharacterized protein isoform X2 n=1 Tax=Dysidea avara TaxID=196820 RepID=UPI00331E47C0